MPLKKIGILHSGSKDSFSRQIEEFLNSLEEAGYVKDENVEVPEPLWADDDQGKLDLNAGSLAGDSSVTVIVAAGGPASAKAAQTATTTKPIVFTTVVDPVTLGLVNDLDEPGTNLTGMAGLTSELDVARLELLHELLPKTVKIGVLTKKIAQRWSSQFAELKDAADRMALTLERKEVNNLAGIDAIENYFPGKVEAILVTADPLFNNRRKKVVGFANKKNFPAIYQWREFAAAGGLMSYGPTMKEAYRQAAVYAARILDGATPDKLPVVFPSEFELVINLKTARTLSPSVKIPGPMLARAILLRRQAPTAPIRSGWGLQELRPFIETTRIVEHSGKEPDHDDEE